MKITKEQIIEIIRLRTEGKTQTELAKQFGVSQNCIRYHTQDDVKKKMKDYQTNRYINFTPEKKKELYLNKKEYARNYYRNKYKNDLIYREKQKERARIKMKEKGNQPNNKNEL